MTVKTKTKTKRKRKQVTVRLPWALWEQLEAQANPGGVSAVVTAILENHFAQERHRELMGHLAMLRARTRSSGYLGSAVEDVRTLRQRRWDGACGGLSGRAKLLGGPRRCWSSSA